MQHDVMACHKNSAFELLASGKGLSFKRLVRLDGPIVLGAEFVNSSPLRVLVLCLELCASNQQLGKLRWLVGQIQGFYGLHRFDNKFKKQLPGLGANFSIRADLAIPVSTLRKLSLSRWDMPAKPLRFGGAAGGGGQTCIAEGFATVEPPLSGVHVTKAELDFRQHRLCHRNLGAIRAIPVLVSRPASELCLTYLFPDPV